MPSTFIAKRSKYSKYSPYQYLFCSSPWEPTVGFEIEVYKEICKTQLDIKVSKQCYWRKYTQSKVAASWKICWSVTQKNHGLSDIF